MVIDDFVYDPSTSLRKLVANLIKGTFRLITGKVTRGPGSAAGATRSGLIRLYVGTIGIRGTDVQVHVAPDGSGYIKLFHGRVDVTLKSGSVVHLKQGEEISIFANGMIGKPQRLTP